MMPKQEVPHSDRKLVLKAILILSATVLVWPQAIAWAHGVSASDQDAMLAGSALDFVQLGAAHMLTGYDHLLFLFGVIFFLSSFRDVLRFITAFTVGHCITLLGATLAGIQANAYLIDAVIAVSVIYKGFENLDGFKRVFKKESPNLLWMVFIFGLIHGFGLSTRLQEIQLGEEGLVSRIISFNIGVEVGQVAALSVMILLFTAWRKYDSFERWSVRANQGLLLAGAVLFTYQMYGYFTDTPPQSAPEAHHEPHQHDKETPPPAPPPPEKTPDETPDVTPEAEEQPPKEKVHQHKHDHQHGSKHSH